MVKLIALYTKPEDSTAFDRRYRETHVPLVGKMPGLRRIEISRIVGAPGGRPRYHLMAEMYFDSHDAMKAALASEAGKAAGKDIMSFAGKLIHMMFAEVEET